MEYIYNHWLLGGLAKLAESTKSACSCLSVRHSVRVKQLGSHWTDSGEFC
jgi:hypothetical protein